MKNKLYVGNLSFSTDERGLEDAFAAHGTVKSVKIIVDRESGRSRGFGFVEMETDEEAQACIDNLNEKDLGGRNLKVNLAQEKEGGPRGGGGGGFRSGNRGPGGPRGGGGGHRGGPRGGGHHRDRDDGDRW